MPTVLVAISNYGYVDSKHSGRHCHKIRNGRTPETNWYASSTRFCVNHLSSNNWHFWKMTAYRAIAMVDVVQSKPRSRAALRPIATMLSINVWSLWPYKVARPRIFLSCLSRSYPVAYRGNSMKFMNNVVSQAGEGVSWRPLMFSRQATSSKTLKQYLIPVFWQLLFGRSLWSYRALSIIKNWRFPSFVLLHLILPCSQRSCVHCTYHEIITTLQVTKFGPRSNERW